MLRMPRLDDLDDLDLTTVELDDGTPLIAEWRASAAGGGTWVARGSLPASAVAVDLDACRNRLTPAGLYPDSMSLQDLVASWQHDGFNAVRKVTDEDPDGPTQARSFFLTDYRRNLPPNEVGTNGSLFGVSYGRPGEPAGGFANITTIVGEIRASEDPANEIGGCIASLQMGKGNDPPPTGSLWGVSYTLRGPVERQPGGLMAYSAVVQNYFDGTGSRSPNYGYAALTLPGIGDGADWHVHDPIRHATTYPIDNGFIVCGDSGPFPEGGNIGFHVAFQAGGGASPWADRDHWRSRIGVGLLVRDWLETGVHVQAPHIDAGAVPHVLLNRRDGQEGNLLECRSEDGLGLLAAIRPDGRLAVAEGVDPIDAITRTQLERAVAALRDELREEFREALDESAEAPHLSGVPTRGLARELTRRAPRLLPNLWRRVGRRRKSRRTARAAR